MIALTIETMARPILFLQHWSQEVQELTKWIGVYGCQDFHAVCGDIDIPWATEEAREVWGEKQASSCADITPNR